MKKLTADELMEEFLRIFARWGGLIGKEMQTYEQLKDLILKEKNETQKKL